MDLIDYWLLYKRIMKVAFFTTLTFLLLFGCSETPEYQGTYSGILVMDDGISEVARNGDFVVTLTAADVLVET